MYPYYLLKGNYNLKHPTFRQGLELLGKTLLFWPLISAVWEIRGAFSGPLEKGMSLFWVESMLGSPYLGKLAYREYNEIKIAEGLFGVPLSGETFVSALCLRVHVLYKCFLKLCQRPCGPTLHFCPDL